MTQFRLRQIAALTLLLASAGIAPARAQTPDPAETHHHDHGGMRMEHEPDRCQETTLHCASSATPFFAPDGTLWLTWSAGKMISVAHSPDLGAHFSDPVIVTPEPIRLDSGGDSRPTVVVDKAGRITVAYALFQDARYNGAVLLTRSTDNGAHFFAPEPITTDSPSQRFQAMGFDPDGRLFAAWLDKRDVAAARAKGEKYAGAALAFAWADDGGALPAARIAVDNTCECCRLGLGWMGPGRPVIAFRDIFEDQYRDHAVVVFQDRDTPGPVHRVSDDHWRVDACPHHGPTLAVSPRGTIHTAWFSGGGPRKGVYYAHSVDGPDHFSEPMRLGAEDRQISRPVLLAVGPRIYLGWKSFDGERTEVQLMISPDDGATWGPVRTIAAATGQSDHPQLVANGKTVFLSWMAREAGYRLIPLDPAS